jgi:hypothetical protein
LSEPESYDSEPVRITLDRRRVMKILKILSATIIVFWFVGAGGAGPRQNKYRHDPTAGYTFYTSHGSVVGAKPVHNWQTYDDSCDLPSEGCDDNHRLGIGG